MDETQTKPLTQHVVNEDLLETDETGPLINPDIYEHICLLYDGHLTRAIYRVLDSPVVEEIAPQQYIQYPSPTVAWQRDPIFRQWACRLGEAMHRRSVESKTRFNILTYINAITDYDSSYQSFAEWYRRQWRRGNQYNSWTMKEIQRARLTTYKDIKSIPNT